MRWVIFAPDLATACFCKWQEPVVRFGLRGSVQIASAGVRTRALSKPCRSAPRVRSRASLASAHAYQCCSAVPCEAPCCAVALPSADRTRPVESRALNSSLFAAAMSDSLAAPRPGMRASMPSLSWQKSRKCCQDQLQRPRAGRLAS
jgi:hypothetical protein